MELMKDNASTFVSGMITEGHLLGSYARLLMLIGALVSSSAYGQERLDPLETATKFFEANRASRCTEAYNLYSKGTQENILAEMHRYDRDREGPPTDSTPQTRTCSPIKVTKRGSIRLVRQNSYEAVVARKYSIGHWLNKFIAYYGTYMEGAEELRLIQENGTWHVDLPRFPIGRERYPDERLIEVGRVDVSTFPYNRLGQDVVFATVVTHVPRNKIEAVLRDPAVWTKLFPQIQSVNVLEATKSEQRVSLVFAGWDHPIIITMKTPYETIDRLRFDAGWNAPVMFTGWWNLSQHHDGTRIDLNVVISQRQWPNGMGEQLQAPERVAEAVLGLEKAALNK